MYTLLQTDIVTLFHSQNNNNENNQDHAFSLHFPSTSIDIILLVLTTAMGGKPDKYDYFHLPGGNPSDSPKIIQLTSLDKNGPGLLYICAYKHSKDTHTHTFTQATPLPHTCEFTYITIWTPREPQTHCCLIQTPTLKGAEHS